MKYRHACNISQKGFFWKAHFIEAKDAGWREALGLQCVRKTLLRNGIVSNTVVRTKSSIHGVKKPLPTKWPSQATIDCMVEKKATCAIHIACLCHHQAALPSAVSVWLEVTAAHKFIASIMQAVLQHGSYSDASEVMYMSSTLVKSSAQSTCLERFAKKGTCLGISNCTLVGSQVCETKYKSILPLKKRLFKHIKLLWSFFCVKLWRCCFQRSLLGMCKLMLHLKQIMWTV